MGLLVQDTIILQSFNNTTIDIVTKQRIYDKTTFSHLDEINDLTVYDYFIIANETVKHYTILAYINQRVTDKIILVEKPLFNKYNGTLLIKNNVYAAYNLRFHPILQQLKKLMKDTTIYFVHISCGQYLPLWKPQQDYNKAYNADKKQGGGVLKDLSHEIDYLSWLFGDITDIRSINSKISDLEINSDDIFTAIGKTKQGILFNISIDYISKQDIRKIVLHLQNETIKADFIKGCILITNKKGAC